MGDISGRARSLAGWFWTGPLGHLLGGGLDLGEALLRLGWAALNRWVGGQLACLRRRARSRRRG